MNDVEESFDDYLREELKEPGFAQGFAEASEAWDMVLDLVRLREEKGLTQAQLAEMVGTKQQNIARIENPAYEGHSLSLLRRVARALGMVVHVEFVPPGQVVARELGEDRKPAPTVYRRKRKPAATSVNKAMVVRETPPD